MEAAEIAALLGLASTDPRVEAQLARFGIDDRPHVTIDLEDADGPVVETHDWLINNGLGIEFGFEDEASWRGFDESEHGRLPMLLTQIYFYGDHEDVRPYRGHLPFGLELSDTRNVVLAKLRALERMRRSYVRDTWELPEFTMTVSYTEAGIGFVLCMLRPDPLPPVDDELARLPTIEAIVKVFGRRWHDREFRDVFGPFHPERHAEEVRQGEDVDFRTTYGFELGFGGPTSAAERPATRASNPVFSQVVFYRDRELESRGWAGKLPFGILFDDSPEAAMRKVRLPPDEHDDEWFEGYALWHLRDFSLHVNYSTMENWILRVRLMAPGVWTALQAE